MRTVELHLGDHAGEHRLDLSGAVLHPTIRDGEVRRGETLFLVSDEGADLLRLRPTGPDAWGDPVAFPLADALDLPGDPGDEVDAEAVDVAGGCLWIAGSHSPKRRRVKEGTAPEDVADRLARTSSERSRRLLARIPLVDGPDGPVPAARGREVPGLGPPARLPAGRRGLLGALADDPHLGPFVGLPGKDNGLDVEGLAVVGPGAGGPTRVLLGLRGPVLRGWAVVLAVDVRPVATDDGPELALVGLTKHFLDLEGLGIRDLARDGDDLLLLAGPTMVLDGPARVLRLPGGATGELAPAVDRDGTEVVAELAVGRRCDRPEGLAVVGDGLLVVHDAPSADRIRGASVLADLLVGGDLARPGAPAPAP